ncbi:MAG: N-6 DNA methylase [Fimbriimonadaceae bacterium]|nr:N-6 DNA methylase [Fimbriimonadaceae bacterium]
MDQDDQLVLGGMGTPHQGLFDPKLLANYLTNESARRWTDDAPGLLACRRWAADLEAAGSAEASLEHGFLSAIWQSALGYLSHPANAATLYPKPPSSLTGAKGTPDAVLGDFSQSSPAIWAVLELKSPGTDLDKAQASYPEGRTPVEQAHHYARQIIGSRWVVVSDMVRLRLYAAGNDTAYEEVRLLAGLDARSYGRLWQLFSAEKLIRGGQDSAIARLFAKAAEARLEIRDGFYATYRNIRAVLYDHLAQAARRADLQADRRELQEATQRLLDRLLFLYYCEDHPDQLIPPDTVQRIVSAARALPSRRDGRVYEALKELFVDADQGSVHGSEIPIPAYNGELFKHHRILDRVDLPNALHDRVFAVPGKGQPRSIQGVWGLHVYDFWRDLDEHMLGQVFEESLAELDDLGSAVSRDAPERLQRRRQHGVYYTTSLLTEFVVDQVLDSHLAEYAPLTAIGPADLANQLSAREAQLRNITVVDPACGSGAFLTTVYGSLLRQLRSAARRRAQLCGTEEPLGNEASSRLLRSCVYGADLLPQAVEIAKLALWLRSAEKGERVASLDTHLQAADSLRAQSAAAWLHTPGQFDLVVGNPPWGGAVDDAAEVAEALQLPPRKWDSWELFVALAIRLLRPGGRLALVLPDSLLYEEKAPLRAFLAEHTAVEYVHRVGPDWFGKQVRMDALLLQARKGPAGAAPSIGCLNLAGPERTQVQRGQVALKQVAAQRMREVDPLPLRRPPYPLCLVRSRADDRLIAAIRSRSRPLSALCEWHRGEEINKAGRLWCCPSCDHPTTPGRKIKGGYAPKPCPICGLILLAGQVSEVRLVEHGDTPPAGAVPFVDGDDITSRYARPGTAKWLRAVAAGPAAKSAAIYRSPKILVRQAGVGLAAMLDLTDARCPQSIYVYRPTTAAEAAGFDAAALLGVLLSRTMFYFVVKSFGEVDPAKAFAKLTHARLHQLPVPSVADQQQRSSLATIAAAATALTTGEAALGGPEDLRIEQEVRSLWGITPDDGAYINAELRQLPASQALRALFPDPSAAPPRRSLDPDP